MPILNFSHTFPVLFRLTINVPLLFIRAFPLFSVPSQHLAPLQPGPLLLLGYKSYLYLLPVPSHTKPVALPALSYTKPVTKPIRHAFNLHH